MEEKVKVFFLSRFSAGTMITYFALQLRTVILSGGFFSLAEL